MKGVAARKTRGLHSLWRSGRHTVKTRNSNAAMVPTAIFRPISRKYQYLRHLQERNGERPAGSTATFSNFPRGLFFSVDNISNADQMLGWTVLPFWGLVTRVTPIGKLALYTAAGGVSPFQKCPITLDAGTGREDLLSDPMYLAVKTSGLTGEAYMAMMEFV